MEVGLQNPGLHKIASGQNQIDNRLKKNEGYVDFLKKYETVRAFMLEFAARLKYNPVLRDNFHLVELQYHCDYTVPIEHRMLDPRVVDILLCVATNNTSSLDHISAESILYACGYITGKFASRKINARSVCLAILAHSD
jgi:hypothetical protein